MTVSSGQDLLDEDRGAVGPGGAAPDGDAQTAGPRHWNELNDSFTRMTEDTETHEHNDLWRKDDGEHRRRLLLCIYRPQLHSSVC